MRASLLALLASIVALVLSGCTTPESADQAEDKDLDVSNTKGMFSLGGETTAESTTYNFDWETDRSKATVAFAGTADSGAFVVTIHDAAGEEVFANTFDEGNEGFQDETEPGTAGSWKIKVKFESFTGDVGLSIYSS